jgi:hypothetical protein
MSDTVAITIVILAAIITAVFGFVVSLHPLFPFPFGGWYHAAQEKAATFGSGCGHCQPHAPEFNLQ